MNPDALPESDPTQMNFASSASKAWRDIWGAGQGVGSIDAVVPAAELVARWQAEYAAALARL
jgi:nitronate monooxygenase